MFQTKNEIAIGKIIEKIKNADLFFSGVNSVSNINIAKMNKKMQSPCDMLKKYKSDQFILMRIKLLFIKMWVSQ